MGWAPDTSIQYFIHSYKFTKKKKKSKVSLCRHRILSVEQYTTWKKVKGYENTDCPVEGQQLDSSPEVSTPAFQYERRMHARTL